MEEHKEHTTEHHAHEHHTKSTGKMRIKRSVMWQGVSLILLIALIASVYTEGFKNFGSAAAEIEEPAEITGDGLNIILLNDERCTTCDTTQLVAQLQSVFPDMSLKELDYGSDEGKELFETTGLSVLPAVLFTEDVKTDPGYSQVEQFLDSTGDYLSLRVGAAFDPTAEICDNEIDDNGDGDVDCEDETCKAQWICMDKKDKPVVEAFVMSHCPYGTQIEKGLIPVVELLGDKIDFKVKFCDYAMHGENEVNEEVQQYCIQKEQNTKYLDYLKCFLKAGDSAACVKEAGVDQDKLDSCIESTNEEFDIQGILADQTRWKGNFPTFPIFQSEVNKYGVAGSPTLVINGATASTGRDPSSLLAAVCTGFKEKPAECSESLDTASFSPGFGFDTTGAATAATCG